MALSSCPIAFSNKSNVFTNTYQPALSVHGDAYEPACVHADTRMPEAHNGSRLLVEQPRIYPLLSTVYTRSPSRLPIYMRSDQRIYICMCVCVYVRRQKRFNHTCIRFSHDVHSILKLLILGSELIAGRVVGPRVSLLLFDYSRISTSLPQLRPSWHETGWENVVGWRFFSTRELCNFFTSTGRNLQRRIFSKFPNARVRTKMN